LRSSDQLEGLNSLPGVSIPTYAHHSIVLEFHESLHNQTESINKSGSEESNRKSFLETDRQKLVVL